MRLFWLLLASCFAFSARAQQSGHLHNPNKGNPGTFTSGDITARTGSGGYSINSTGYSGTGSNINVVYHRVNWTIDPNSATKTITGTVVTYFKTLVANVSSITFDLNSTSFSNGSLIVTHHGNTCTKTCASNILTITLSSTIATLGTLDSVTINYSGIPP